RTAARTLACHFSDHSARCSIDGLGWKSCLQCSAAAIPTPKGIAMSDDNLFQNLIGRVRAGDQDAATELVRSYEPAIRRAVRFRLKDTRLRQHLDSMDICQSVLASFFVRAALGQFELEESEQLLKLLTTMVRNKVANQVDKR